jgi:hypothetical protein
MKKTLAETERRLAVGTALESVEEMVQELTAISTRLEACRDPVVGAKAGGGRKPAASDLASGGRMPTLPPPETLPSVRGTTHPAPAQERPATSAIRWQAACCRR